MGSVGWGSGRTVTVRILELMTRGLLKKEKKEGMNQNDGNWPEPGQAAAGQENERWLPLSPN